MQFTGRVGEVVDLEPTHQFLDVRMRCEQRRNDDQRAQLRRHTITQRQPRQNDGPKQLRDGVADRGHCTFECNTGTE